MDPLYGDSNESKRQSSKKVLKIVGVVVALLALAAIGYGIYAAVAKSKEPVSNAAKTGEKAKNALSVQMDGGLGQTYAHGCYMDPTSYDAAEALEPVDPALVPPYQAAVQSLPAMQKAHLQQEYSGTGIGPSAREGIDPISNATFDSTAFGPDDDYSERVKQTEGVGVSSIYSRGDKKGISMINQKSRMIDPTKMVPQVDPSRQSQRMVQAGPSIEDIGCRVPKAADIMRLLRASRGNALSHQIPRDKPPVYTEGLNAFRQTPLPQSAGDTGCTIGISPYEVSDLIDYAPNPFLQRSRSTEVGYNYSP